MDYQYCDTCHASDETVQLRKIDEVLCFNCWGSSEGRNERRRNRGCVMNVDNEISSAVMFESDREERKKELVAEELLRKMKALCSTDISKSERPVEDYEDNESENETDDNDKNMHEKQDAAGETDSTSEGHHDDSVRETRSSVCQGNQSTSQDGSQNGCGKCGKRVVNGGICNLCKKFFHFKCAGTTKEKVQDASVLICKVCKEKCSNVQITASIKQEQKRDQKPEVKHIAA